MIGTLEYMAPEQVRGESNVDARVDVYALGAVLYEMLAGKRPYQGAEAHVVMYRILEGRAAPLIELRAAYPRAFSKWCSARCIPIPKNAMPALPSWSPRSPRTPRSRSNLVAGACALNSTAATAVEVSASARAEAKRHYEHAKQLVKAEAFEEAAVEFQQAYEIAPHFEVLYDLGQCHVALGRPMETLTRYLAEGSERAPGSSRRRHHLASEPQHVEQGRFHVFPALFGQRRDQRSQVAAVNDPDPLYLQDARAWQPVCLGQRDLPR